MEPTATTLVSVLFATILFLLFLYLEQRRKVARKKQTISRLTKENVSLIKKVYNMQTEITLLKYPKNEGS